MRSFLPRPTFVKPVKPQAGFVEPESTSRLNPQPRPEFVNLWDEGELEKFEPAYTPFPQAPDPNEGLRK